MEQTGSTDSKGMTLQMAQRTSLSFHDRPGCWLRAGFQNQTAQAGLYHLPAGWPWARYFSLSVPWFLSLKMGIEVCCDEDFMSQYRSGGYNKAGHILRNIKCVTYHHRRQLHPHHLPLCLFRHHCHQHHHHHYYLPKTVV